MTDSQLCRLIAEVWVEHGGDANGFLFCQRKITESIKDVIEDMKKEEENAIVSWEGRKP